MTDSDIKSEEQVSATEAAMNELQDALTVVEVRQEVAEAQSTMLSNLIGNSITSVINQQQLMTLWEPTPEHAIKFRPGPGGRSMPYVPHGFVEFKLNKAFGGDWDIEPMPVFNGSVFHLQQSTLAPRGGKETVVYYLTVMCKLTVRVRNPETMEVIATIVKMEPGSSQWFPENEFGDALKSACSDSLKRCGLRLGIALDLYYDDNREQVNKQEQANAAKKMAEAMKAEKAKKESLAPSDVPSILLKVNNKYNVKLKELTALLYGADVNVATGMTRMTNDLKTLGAEKFWEVIESACSPANTIIDNGVQP
jgi:hypothetical protein